VKQELQSNVDLYLECILNKSQLPVLAEYALLRLKKRVKYYCICIELRRTDIAYSISSVIQAVRHYATSRKITGSIPENVNGFFNSPNPSSRTIVLGWTQPLNRNEYQKSSWG
jgi:hypothetical protein